MFVATHFEVRPHQYVTAGCEIDTAVKILSSDRQLPVLSALDASISTLF